jgi:hypothetical protein
MHVQVNSPHTHRPALIAHTRASCRVVSVSYDVTLGRYYFRESPPEPGMGIYNPFSEKHVQRVWGSPLEAERAADWMARTG